MSSRETPLVAKEYYHIYNRGNSKQTIFHDREDYNFFIFLLEILNTDKKQRLSRFNKEKNKQEDKEELLYIGAYCLMPNHFHILATSDAHGGISKFMQKVCTGYVGYYNKKYKRTGSLFEGKFKSKHVAGDEYMKYLYSYIHLNPLKLWDKDWKSKKNFSKDALLFLEGYPYSSFLHYALGKEKISSFIDRSHFPVYFPTSKSFVNTIEKWFSSEASLEFK